MRNIKHFNLILLILAVFLFFSFYWLGFRPYQIKRYCIQQAKIGAENKFRERAKNYPENKLLQKQAKEGFFYQSDYDYCYKLCLKQYSLKK